MPHLPNKPNRPNKFDAECIENLLLNGLPPPPESRATKYDLEKHIEKLRYILQNVRRSMIHMIITEIETNVTTREAYSSHEFNELPADYADALFNGKEVVQERRE